MLNEFTMPSRNERSAPETSTIRDGLFGAAADLKALTCKLFPDVYDVPDIEYPAALEVLWRMRDRIEKTAGDLSVRVSNDEPLYVEALISVTALAAEVKTFVSLNDGACAAVYKLNEAARMIREVIVRRYGDYGFEAL
jgi:hypothetical protein